MVTQKGDINMYRLLIYSLIFLSGCVMVEDESREYYVSGVILIREGEHVGHIEYYDIRKPKTALTHLQQPGYKIYRLNKPNIFWEGDLEYSDLPFRCNHE